MFKVVLPLCFLACHAQASTLQQLPQHHSFIEQALIKQQQSPTQVDDLKILTTIHVQPTQTFFARQQDSFSRFLHTYFFPRES